MILTRDIYLISDILPLNVSFEQQKNIRFLIWEHQISQFLMMNENYVYLKLNDTTVFYQEILCKLIRIFFNIVFTVDQKLNNTIVFLPGDTLQADWNLL